MGLREAIRLRFALLSLALILCSTDAQHQHADLAALASPDNMKKFSEIYGFATQIMNLGGSFISGGNGGGGSGTGNSGTNGLWPGTFTETNNYLGGVGSSSNPNSLNSVLSEFMKPSYEVTPNQGYSGYKSSMFSRSPYKQTYGEYGGGPLGAAGSRSQSRSIIDTLMGTFLGSSVDPDPPSSSSLYAPSFSEYGGTQQKSPGGSNIDAIVRSLVRSGAKRADESESDGATSFLTQFFGRK